MALSAEAFRAPTVYLSLGMRDVLLTCIWVGHDAASCRPRELADDARPRAVDAARSGWGAESTTGGS